MRLLPFLSLSSTRDHPRDTDVPGRPAAWVRRYRRHRRLLAALLAGVVAWSLATTVSPPPPATSRVLVATRDLGAGTTVTADDLTSAERPTAQLAADAATAEADVVARALVSPVRLGEVIRDRDILDSSLLDGLGAGVVATPVRVGDPAAASLLRGGDLVDVIATGESSTAVTASVVASGVRVLVVPSRAAAGGTGLFGSSADITGSDGLLVVLATTTSQALDIARAGLRGRLSFILRSR